MGRASLGQGGCLSRSVSWILSVSPFLCFSVSLSLSLSLGLWAGASRSCPGSPRWAGWGRGAGLLGGAGGGTGGRPASPLPQGQRGGLPLTPSGRAGGSAWVWASRGPAGAAEVRAPAGRPLGPEGTQRSTGPAARRPDASGQVPRATPPPSSRISCDPSPDPSGQGGLECSRAARGERPARRPAPIPAPTAAPTTPRFPPPPAPPRLLAPRAAPGLRALGGQQGGAAQGLAGPLAAPEAAAAGGSSGRKAAGRARAQGAPAAGARHRGLGAREPRAGRRGAAS